MRRCIATILVLLGILAIQPVWADADREAIVKEHLAEAKVRLDLSDEQLEQVKPIMKATIEAQRSILAQFGIDLEAEGDPKTRLGLRKARQLRSELTEIRAGTLENLDDILSDEQLNEFRKIQEESRQAMRNRISGGS